MRVLTTAQTNALHARRVRVAYLLECAFPTGMVRFSTAAHTLIYNNVEWLGAGAMLDIKFPDEDGTLEVHPAEITLNGMDPALVSMALREQMVNTPVAIYIALFDPDTNQPIGNAFRYMRGTLSHLRIMPPTQAGMMDDSGG